MKRILIGSLLLVLASSSWAGTVLPEQLSGQTVPLGQVLSEDARVDGRFTPPGTTLLSGSEVRTHQDPVLIHLSGGEVVWLDSRTAAAFERTPAGETVVSVEVGRATVRSASSDPSTLAGEESIVLASLSTTQETGEVGTGAEVGAPRVEGAGETCLPGAPFPVIDAQISPAAAVDVAKVYFRAGQFFNFYSVEMRRQNGRFQAVLPQPDPETREVVYYVEVTGLSGDSSRTEEYVAEVASAEECERQGGAGRFLGGKPPAAFISTATGASAEPPGFLFEDDEPAAVVASSGGGSWFGGLSTGAKIGLVAGGAAGIGILINELDDDDEEAASPITP